jgi:hypothetical protein
MKKITLLLFLFSIFVHSVSYAQTFDFNGSYSDFAFGSCLDHIYSPSSANDLAFEVCDTDPVVQVAQAIEGENRILFKGNGIGNAAGDNKIVNFTRASGNSFGATSITVVPVCYSSTGSAPFETTDFSIVGYKNGSITGTYSVNGATHETSYAIDLTQETGFNDIDVLRINTGVQDFAVDQLVLVAPSASNSAPTDITLDNNSINQSATGVNASVGTLTTTDADAGDSHTYSLVAGTGDTDNGSFNISGSTLRTSSALAAGSYSVRINTNDGTDNYAEQFSITVTDDVAPVITSVSVPIPGTYILNQNLDFTVNFDENVTVNTTGGTPQLAITIGSTTRQAVFQSGSGTQDLAFRYTVQDGDADGDGIAVGTLSANGGTLRDAANNDANLTLNSVGNTSNVNVLATDVTYSSGSYSPTDPSGLNLTGYTLEVQDGTAVISSATTFDDVTVQPDAVLDLNANLTVNNQLLFQSDANGAGQLADATGANITGNVTVERFMSANRAFRLINSTVSGSETIRQSWQEGATSSNFNPRLGYGTHITGVQGSAGNVAANGLDETQSGNHSMFSFNNSTGVYQEVDDTNITLNANTPYVMLIRGDRSIDLDVNTSEGSTILSSTGTMNIGTRTSGTHFSGLSSTADAYSLVPNPYQSIVDVCGVVTDNNLNKTIWTRDVAAGTNGSWLTIDVSNTGLCAPSSPPSPSTTNSQFLPPGIAFFVQTTANGSASIEFTESDKAPDASQPLTTVYNQTSMFYINARLYTTAELQNGDVERDAVGLRFDNQFTTAATNAEDAVKFLNDDENFAVENNGLRAIDKQSMPSLGDVVQLHTSGFTQSQYSIMFMLGNLPDGLGAFINDAYLDTQTEITNGFVYDFTVDSNIPESKEEDRFSLVFDNTTLGVAENAFSYNFNLYPNPAQNGRFYITTPGLSGAAQVTLTNVLGQQVYVQELNILNQEVQIDADNLSSGVYMLNLSQGNQSYSIKVIIE